MNKDSIAILVSTASILVASLSLGWNIYRDIVLKARLKVRCIVGFIASPVLKTTLDRVIVSATNLGPGKIRCSMIFLSNRSIWRRIFRKIKYAALVHDYTDPLSGQLPCDLEIGEGRDFLFKFEKDCFLSGDWSHIGIKDSFGRIHWAPKSNMKIANKMYQDKFIKKKS